MLDILHANLHIQISDLSAPDSKNWAYFYLKALKRKFSLKLPISVDFCFWRGDGQSISLSDNGGRFRGKNVLH